MKENWRQSEICIAITDKLLVKEFLKSMKIWQSYRQNG